jgi:mono/diheme cytochrome c family protein
MKKKKKILFFHYGAILILLTVGLIALIPNAKGQPPGDPVLGKGIYLKNCAHCHGRRGEGLGPRSALPNFSDLKYMAQKKDQELFDKVTRGGSGTGMPSFGKMLSERDRWNVVAYLRTLSSPP